MSLFFGLSYIEVEFDFARKLAKPFFSIVITEEGLEAKVKTTGLNVIEKEHPDKLLTFRDKVTSQLCAFFSNEQDIKLAVFETLPQFSESISVGGWVKASEVTPSEDVAKQLTRLLDENEKLRAQNSDLKNRIATTQSGLPNFQQLARTLAQEKITIPTAVSGKKPIEKTLLTLTIQASDDLARGVSNQGQVSELEAFIFYNVASRLAAFGLAEHVKVPPTAMWQRLKLSKDGIKFVTQAKMRLSASTESKTDTDGSKSTALPKSDAEDATKRMSSKRKRDK